MPGVTAAAREKSVDSDDAFCGIFGDRGFLLRILVVVIVKLSLGGSLQLL